MLNTFFNTFFAAPRQVGVGGPRTADDWPRITMYGVDFRHELHVMYTVALERGVLQQFAADPGDGGFMYRASYHAYTVLSDPRVMNCGHSGATEDFAMRCIQIIARDGWDAFCARYSNIQSDPDHDAPGVPG